MNNFDNKVGGQLKQSKSISAWYWLLASSISLILGLFVATQTLAVMWGFNNTLGENFLFLYWPWKIMSWIYYAYSQYPDDFFTAFSAGALSILIGLAGFVGFFRAHLRSQSIDDYLHGSARWATKEDIKQAGLLNNGGVYVGAWRCKRGKIHYLRHEGAEHILTFAPTRSGKGVGLVVTTLLSWKHSAVVLDMKGELWALSSGWRKHYANNVVLRFEPSSSYCVPWNPLDEIRINTDKEVGDAQNIALLLIDQDGTGLKDHWQKRAFALLTGCIIHLKYKALKEGSPATLSTLDTMLSNPIQPLDVLWAEMMTYTHCASGSHLVAAQTGRDMIDTPDKEAGSIVSTAKNALSLYRDTVVAKNVSTSGFCIKDLMHKTKAGTLYIIIPPSDKERIMPLIRILISMIVRVLADKVTFEKGLPVPHYKHRLLLLLDEFPSLGKMMIIQESLAFIAGFGLKAFLITQDLDQLYNTYGLKESITSNCHIQNAYQPLKLDTAHYLSRMAGTTTIKRKRYQHKRGGGKSHTFSWEFTQRPLMTEDEVRTMPGPKKQGDKIIEAGDMLIFAAGMPAIYGRQPLYFQDPKFLARATIEAPEKSDTFIEFSPVTVNLNAEQSHEDAR